MKKANETRNRYEQIIMEVVHEKIADYEVRSDGPKGCVIFVLLWSGELLRVEETPGHWASRDWLAAWVERSVTRRSI